VNLIENQNPTLRFQTKILCVFLPKIQQYSADISQFKNERSKKVSPLCEDSDKGSQTRNEIINGKEEASQNILDWSVAAIHVLNVFILFDCLPSVHWH
jgi:hypothetical protein